MTPRSKSGSETKSQDWYVEYMNNYPNGSWVRGSKKTTTWTSSTKQTSGYDIPKFHKRRREGELLPYTPFEQTTYDRTIKAGTYFALTPANKAWRLIDEDWRSYGLSWTDETYLATVANTYIDDVDSSQMVQAAAAKIYSQGHDSLTFLLELNKTIKLFKDLIPRLRSLIKKTTAKEAGKTAAQAWLEYRYGWRILVYDMIDIHKTLSNLSDSRKRFSDRVGNSNTYVTSDSKPSWNDPSVNNISINTTDVITVGVRGSVTADIEPPKFQFNPAVSGWELIRFSFIVDWFIGVGTWLEALSFLALQQNYVAAGGHLITVERTVSYGDAVYNSGHSGTIDSGGPDVAVYSIAKRTPQSVPYHPYANINLDVFKITDLVALLATAVKGFGGALRL